MTNRKAASVRERAAYLKTLERGWDSYNGDPIDHATIDKAHELALKLAHDLGGPGYLVPCSDGTVQVEWHDLGWDIEVWVSHAV